MPQEIQRVGVVGCGLMGAGIAEVCAKAGYMVVVREVNKDFLEAGMARINGSLDKAVARGKLPAASRDDARARIIGTTDMGAFSGCDLIVEAAPENLALQRQIFAELDAVAPAHAILASNTPMGPFTLLDFVGLDTALFIADAVFEETKDPRFAAPPLLRRMVSAGYLGKKSGRGFYEYSK